MALHDARYADLFPRLTEAQISQKVEPFGEYIEVAAGDILFKPGDQDTDLFVIRSGQLDILTVDAHGQEALVVQHGAGDFTGEINMFSRRRNLVLGRVSQAGRMLRVTRTAFRQLVAQHADLSELMLRAFILRRVSLLETQGRQTVLIGSSKDPETLRVRRFLSRSGHPFHLLDIESDPGAASALEAFERTSADLPLVAVAGQPLLSGPSNREIAEVLGIAEIGDDGQLWDVVVVGAGPAGLAAAVYGASEGLRVLCIEADAWGGQAGTSSKIENYLGFPTGISGQALAARSHTQALKFGAQISVSRRVARLDCSALPYALHLDDGSTVRAASVIIASGARYRRLEVGDALARFEGNGIYYGATRVEAAFCAGAQVGVVGGGNSAGQAAIFLAETAAHVHLIIRRADLSATMSRYLIERIEAHPRITIHAHSEVADAMGAENLESIKVRTRTPGQAEADALTELGITRLFVLIGATPNTDFARGCLALDSHGFVLTGADALPTVAGSDASSTQGGIGRTPHFLETSKRAVFAVGDVRAGSVKRVASAVGEGSMAIHFAHRALEESPETTLLPQRRA